MPDMPDDPSKLDFVEVKNQLQILEHIAQKGPLSPGDATLLRQLEARENDLVQEKLSQSFSPPRSGEDVDNIEDWKKACEYAAFRSKAEGLAHRHLQNEAELVEKRTEDIDKFGESEQLDDIHAREQNLQARHYDEERGRYARQFLRSMERTEQMDGPEKQKGHEPDLNEAASAAAA